MKSVKEFSKTFLHDEFNCCAVCRKLKGDWWKSKLCTSCVSPLGRSFLSRGGICKQCGLRVCKNCRHYDVNAVAGRGQVSSSQHQQNWICILCNGSPPNYNTGVLPKSTVVGKSATKSIRRSWTISNPQRGSGQQNSPILKSYTIYREDDNVVTNTRQFNSLPRLGSYPISQSIQDENAQRKKKLGPVKSSEQEINYSTLHPFKNNKSNSNSSINLEELFWDYYDYNIDYNIINSSNRSSCERSLGETEYCSYIIDPGDPQQPPQSQAKQNSSNPTNNYCQNVNQNPNGDTGGGGNNNNNHHNNKSPSSAATSTTGPPHPVKPDRSNKRSSSLNAYDGKRLSFSPLRTYVVLRTPQQQQQPTAVSTKKRSSSFNLDYCGGKRNRANSSSSSTSEVLHRHQQLKQYHRHSNLDQVDGNVKATSFYYFDLKRPFSENQLNCHINKPSSDQSVLLSSERDELVREFIKEPLLSLQRSQNIHHQKLEQQNIGSISKKQFDSGECGSTDFPFNSVPRRKSKITGGEGGGGGSQDRENDLRRWKLLLPSMTSSPSSHKYQRQKKSPPMSGGNLVCNNNDNNTHYNNNNNSAENIPSSSSSSSSTSPQSKQAKYFHHEDKQIEQSSSVQCSKVSTTTTTTKTNTSSSNNNNNKNGGLNNKIVKPPRKILPNNNKVASLSSQSQISPELNIHGKVPSSLLSNSPQHTNQVSSTLPKSYKTRSQEYKKGGNNETRNNFWDSNELVYSNTPNPGLENLLKKSEKILNPGGSGGGCIGVNVVQINQTFPRRKQVKATKESQSESPSLLLLQESQSVNNHTTTTSSFDQQRRRRHQQYPIRHNNSSNNECSSSPTTSSCEELEEVLSAYDDDDDDDNNEVKEIESVGVMVGGGWVYKEHLLAAAATTRDCDTNIFEENQIQVLGGANNLNNRLTDLNSQYAQDARDPDKKNKHQSGGPPGSSSSIIHYPKKEKLHITQLQQQEQQQFRNLRIIKGRSSNEFVTTVQINNDMCHEPILNPVLRIYSQPANNKPPITIPQNPPPSPHHRRRQVDRESASKNNSSVPVSIHIELEKNQNNTNNNNNVPSISPNNCKQKQSDEVVGGVKKLAPKIIVETTTTTTNNFENNDDHKNTITKSELQETNNGSNDDEIVNLPKNNTKNFESDRENISSPSLKEPLLLNQFLDRDSASAASTENSSDDTIIDCSQYYKNNQDNGQRTDSPSDDTLVDVVQLGPRVDVVVEGDKNNSNHCVTELKQDKDNIHSSSSEAIDEIHCLSSSAPENSTTTTNQVQQVVIVEEEVEKQQEESSDDVTLSSSNNNSSVQNNKCVVDKIKEILTLGDHNQVEDSSFPEKKERANDNEKEILVQIDGDSPSSCLSKKGDNSNSKAIIDDNDDVKNLIDEEIKSSQNTLLPDSVFAQKFLNEEEEAGICQQLPPDLPPPLPPRLHANNNNNIDFLVDFQEKREIEREEEEEAPPIIKLNSNWYNSNLTKEFEKLCDNPEIKDNENLLELLHIFQNKTKKDIVKKGRQVSRPPPPPPPPPLSSSSKASTTTINPNFLISSSSLPNVIGGIGKDIRVVEAQTLTLEPKLDDIIIIDNNKTQMLDIQPMTVDFTEPSNTNSKPDEIDYYNENTIHDNHYKNHHHHHNNMSMMMEHNERLTPEGQESFTDDSSNTTKRSSPDGEAIPDSKMSKLEEDNFQVTSSDSDNSDNSWIEEIPYEEGPPPLDLTLHTIVEESCEESCDETESLKMGQSSSSCRKPVVDELENYFNYLDPALEHRKLANEDSEFSDTFSESSEVHHQHHLDGNDDSMMDPVDLASTRLEKYFTNLSYNNNPEQYSEDSVGSESESDDHIKDKKKKVLKHKRSSNVSDDESIFDLDEGNFDTIKKLPKKKVEKEKHQHSSHHHHGQPPSTIVPTADDDGMNPDDDDNDPFGDDQSIDYGSGGSSGIFPTGTTTTNTGGGGSNSNTPTTTTKSKQVLLNRSNSFQWSSDEEVNLMMSKLRHLIKNLMQKSQSTSIESNSQLRYFETELIRLMRSEPELKNIVSEYISSEESDDNEFSQFIKDVVTQQDLQQQQQQPLDYRYSSSGTVASSWNNKPSSTMISASSSNEPQQQMQQQQQMSLGPNSSPALIAKVMHHIGKRLNDWMKDEEEEDGTLKCAPSVSSDLNEDRFSWKGSFESARFESAKRQSAGSTDSISTFESTLAAKRQSVGSTDSISSSDFNNQHQQASGVGVDRSILRSSSLHHLANSQPIEEKKEEEESRENISNSLPKLNQVANMSRAQSLIGIKEKVKSARYRPPGFTQAPSIIKQIDDKMSMSTPAINVHHHDQSPDTPLNLRSSADSISSMMFDHGRINIRGQIEFSLQYNYKLSSLEVRVKQCRDLAETKRNRSDPYVKAYLLPDRSKSGKRKTKTKKNTLNPIFEETLKFPLSLSELQSRTLWLSVWHSDIFGKNEFLGQVLINLKDRVFDDPSPQWWTLEEMSVQVEDRSRGDLILALKWQPRSERSDESTGTLSILVKEAKNISLLSTKNGCPSTFVKCSPLKEANKSHRTKQKTSIARRSLHPVWNQTLYFEDILDDGVEISLWNYDLLMKYDLIGREQIDRNVALWEAMLNRKSFWVEGVVKLYS